VEDSKNNKKAEFHSPDTSNVQKDGLMQDHNYIIILSFRLEEHLAETQRLEPTVPPGSNLCQRSSRRIIIPGNVCKVRLRVHDKPKASPSATGCAG